MWVLGGGETTKQDEQQSQYTQLGAYGYLLPIRYYHTDHTLFHISRRRENRAKTVFKLLKWEKEVIYVLKINEDLT
jgi:hypothetical protein